MTKDKQPNKPPTFLTAISTIILGIMLVGFGTFVMIFVNYFAFISAGLGAVILYIGVIQWRMFQKTLPEYDSETGETANVEHRFGQSIEQKFYNDTMKKVSPRVRKWFEKGDEFYDEETLAEKRP